jgi:hypothetical protein
MALSSLEEMLEAFFMASPTCLHILPPPLLEQQIATWVMWEVSLPKNRMSLATTWGRATSPHPAFLRAV